MLMRSIEDWGLLSRVFLSQVANYWQFEILALIGFDKTDDRADQNRDADYAYDQTQNHGHQETQNPGDLAYD